MKSYRDLEIYQKAFDLAIKVHKFSWELPAYEKFEIGSQIRKSAMSIKDNMWKDMEEENISRNL